jgi:hypothetical protein
MSRGIRDRIQVLRLETDLHLSEGMLPQRPRLNATAGRAEGSIPFSIGTATRSNR